MDSLFRRLNLGWVLLLLCALIAPQVDAQTVPVVVNPVQTTVQGVSGTGLQTMVTYEAKAAQTAANSMYYQRGLVAAESTIANGVKSRFAVGPAVATAAVILATGWALDQITGQIYSTPPQAGTSCSGTQPFYYANYYGAPYNSACTPAGIAALVVARYNQLTGASHKLAYIDTIPTTHQASGRFGWSASGTCPCLDATYWYYNANGASHTDPAQPGVAASDAQIATAIRNNPQTWPELFQWPKYPKNSTAPEAQANPSLNSHPMVLPEMTAPMAAVQAQYRTDTGLAPKPAGDPEPIAAPAPNISPAPATAPAPAGTTSSAASASASLSFPVFCTWAASVCTALDWLTDESGSDAPDDVDLPEIDVPVTEQAFVSGLGAGSCPGEIAVEFDFNGPQSFGFSYQPLCDFATYLQPLMLVLGALVSAYILAGRRA